MQKSRSQTTTYKKLLTEHDNAKTKEDTLTVNNKIKAFYEKLKAPPTRNRGPAVKA